MILPPPEKQAPSQIQQATQVQTKHQTRIRPAVCLRHCGGRDRPLGTSHQLLEGRLVKGFSSHRKVRNSRPHKTQPKTNLALQTSKTPLLLIPGYRTQKIASALSLINKSTVFGRYALPVFVWCWSSWETRPLLHLQGRFCERRHVWHDRLMPVS